MTNHVTLSNLKDDGLATPEVGSWVEEKYQLVSLYDSLFSRGMKNKWDCRVYIDLFAGAGRSKIRGTNRIIAGSPFLALNVKDKFDKYIFCEEKGKLLNVLRQRVKAQYPEIDVVYIKGDCNTKVDDVLKEIPRHSPTRKVLSFCFIDPFTINVHFKTIKSLSQRFMDFLIVLAVGMDATRNEQSYSKPGNKHIDHYLGVSDWRTRWREADARGVTFRHFLAQEYANQMEKLGYKKVLLSKMKEVRSDENNLPLYHLAFFSKHELGYKFWGQILKYSTQQQSFPGFEDV